MAVSPVIIKENTSLQTKFSKMDLESRIEISKNTKDAANDRVYG